MSSSSVPASSPVVLSSYDPRGNYLCYVSTALDKQRISVEPVDKSNKQYGSNDSTSLNENFLYLYDSNLRVTVLKWAFLSSNETLCVFIGLNNGEIWLYSPLSNEIIIKISTENSYEIKDFFINKESLWCIDSNDMIYEFNLTDFQLKSHFKIDTCNNLSKLLVISQDKILIASHQIFLIDTNKREILMTYPGHISPISNLKQLNNEFFISSAENDRFLNIYDINNGSTKTVLVGQSNVTHFTQYNENAIAITTEDGNVELFIDPLISNSNKRRAMKSKQSSKRINAINSKDKKPVPIIDIFINNDILNLTYLRNATIPFFHQLQWQKIQDISLTVELQLLSNKTMNRSMDRSLHDQDLASTTTYKEGNARVTSGDNFKHIEDLIKDWELETKNKGEDERLNEEEINNIESLADRLPSLPAATTSSKTKKNIMTGTVTVILSQALQSNDHSLLETVLNNRDERIIRDTIIRLKPNLSVILLERLAERIARQTQRQGSLNIWVKWCLIVHGGYLVSIPNLLKTLSSLHSTLKNRANLLDRLLALETRLNSTLNNLKINDGLSYSDDDDEELAFQKEDEEDEEDVEYNEELDDAGLIEDGEEGESEYESDEESDEASDEETPSTKKSDRAPEEDANEEEEEEEEGYSDVEMA